MSTSICTQEGDIFKKNVCNISCHTYWNYTNINYVWNISNISMLFVNPRKILSSPIYSESNKNIIWRIGLEKDSQNIWNLDILLLARPQGRDILTELEVFILDNNNQSVNQNSSRHILKEAGCVLFENFISEISLFKASNNLLLNDTLRIVCKIKAGATIRNKEIFVIKNDDFNENLSKDLEALFENQNKFSDVSIIAEEMTIKVNKAFLIARSSVFSSIFEHNTLIAVEIKDFPYKVVYEMIRFMYCSKVKGIETMANELLLAAEKYRIADLKKLCEITLGKYLCTSNVIQHLSLADLCNSTYLKDKCIEFLKTHVNGTFKKEKLKEISLLDSKLMLEVCLALNSE